LKVLPRYFKEKYESFRCLLEQWGFLKLSKGQNRGCWYQRNFVYGDRSKFQNVSKKQFLSGMPEYLGPRDEPDFTSLTTALTRIPTKRKAKKIESLTIDNDGYVSKATPTTQTEQNLVMSSMKSEDTSNRGRLARKLKGDDKVQCKIKASHSVVPEEWDEGCALCGKDDDHPNLLLCEACDTEIHTYCLSPPLDSVPDDDWFCGE
jgi:hypothetical protein